MDRQGSTVPLISPTDRIDRFSIIPNNPNHGGTPPCLNNHGGGTPPSPNHGGGTPPCPNHNTSSIQNKYNEDFGGTTCPTCKGTGKIPRGQEDVLVALIPYSDKRLKPRRTLLWVLLSVLACCVFAGILSFFLIPRQINIDKPEAHTYKAKLNKTRQILLIELNFMFNVTNTNYVPVDVKTVNIKAQLNNQVVAQTTYSNTTKVHARSTKMLTIPMNISINASGDGSYILTICDPDQTIRYPHLLYLIFDVTMHTHLLSQDKENSLNTYPIHVSCVTPKQS